MFKKVLFSAASLCILVSTVIHADILYCPQPSQIKQEKIGNGFWLYDATVDGHSWAQFGGYSPQKGADAATFINTTIFPYSAGYVGDMQCNYTATNGTQITLWTQVHIKPAWGFAGNAWKDSILHNGIYPCGSNLISACPAITVQNT